MRKNCGNCGSFMKKEETNKTGEVYGCPRCPSKSIEWGGDNGR